MNTQIESLKVLVVDDEPELCQGVLRILRRYRAPIAGLDVEAEFEIESVGSGEDCLKRLEARRPDIILLDQKLPGISGLDVLNRLAERTTDQNEDVLAVMVTAYASLDAAVRATKLGAYDFLAKPFSPEELRYVLRKAATHLLLGRHARRLEEEKRRFRFEFLSILAHELKAPLNAVQGYLDILTERVSGDELQMVDRSLLRLDGMRKIIFDLLDLTRIESGLKRRDLSQVNLADLVRNSIEMMANEAGTRGIRIEFNPQGAVMIGADGGELEIITNNLISNAVKYNRDGGRVDVRLERRRDEVVFQVQDTGIGLTDEEASRLFQEFVRIRNEDTTRILGSGLGLSTVRKLARLYGGDVSVKSERGKGSVFTVTLKDAVVSTMMCEVPTRSGDQPQTLKEGN